MKRKAALIRIFGYLLQHKHQLAFILSLSFLGNLLALAGPRLSGAAINLIAEGMDGKDRKSVVYGKSVDPGGRRGHGREHGPAWSL